MKTREELESKIKSIQLDIEDNQRLGERRARRYLGPVQERHEALLSELEAANDQLAALDGEGEGAGENAGEGGEGEGEGEEKPSTGRRRRTK